jgi:hypothetical protein
MELHKGQGLLKFLLLLSLFSVVFAVIASMAQLWFLPPSSLNAAWMPPHLLAYDLIWNAMHDLARWGLSQGLLPESVRQFKSQGVPAFLPWLGLAAFLLALAGLVGLVSSVSPASAQSSKHEAEPTLAGEGAAQVPPEPRRRPVDSAIPTFTAPAPTAPHAYGAHGAQGAKSERPGASRDQDDGFDKLVEESLLYSEAQLSHAQESVERLRRALVNVYLDAGSTATEDMQDLRTSIEELEITLETLKGEQHRVMAALVSQAAPSSHVSAASH